MPVMPDAPLFAACSDGSTPSSVSFRLTCGCIRTRTAETRPAAPSWATSPIRYFLVALRLWWCVRRTLFSEGSKTKAGNDVSYRNLKERIHARPLYHCDNYD